ncbi:YciI family protein [Snuella sedimenti]|uniref:YCII-related domain-containing protein n=1 Tax=Snuella sedimenti TaxID=2798802 RepID=A0A8J7J1N9_9FLAO|nr:YciI family protein [Snuella sedimenti]MBJ6367379.1 hypothetical protein [Snuella sedimenti]
MRKILVFYILISLLIACKKESKDNQVDLDRHTFENVDKEKDSVFNEVVEVPAKKTVKQIKDELEAKGVKFFDYVDEKSQDTILMQQYFIVFLKKGPIRSQNEEEAAMLQEAHLAHLTKMYELGYADISGPFGDDGDIRGMTIYNVPTLKMADSLANADPMVKAKRLEVEIHPWWAAKGFPLR